MTKDNNQGLDYESTGDGVPNITKVQGTEYPILPKYKEDNKE